VLEACSDPAIVHFIGPFKPWHFRCKSGYRAQWFRYLEGTSWRDRRVEGRSLRHAMFKALPTVWAYNLEIVIDRERARLAARRR
jgi:lipopolysaccharide biosynthesis glycosyltransferase